MLVATDIASVVLMRLGSTTHHTDTEQRHVPMNFASVAGRLLAVPTPDPSVAPPGYYMLFVVDDDGKPCETAEIVRLSHRRCQLVTDRSTFSIDELATGTTTFEHAFYVHVDGFLPSELGVTTATPTAAVLQSLAPAVAIEDGDAPATDINAVPAALHLEDPTLPAGVRQRVTFEYAVEISSDAAFPSPGTDLKTLNVVATTSVDVHGTTRHWRCRGKVQLTRQANPFMLDGATHWLSMDVRVFRVRAGDDPFAITTPITNPTGYIQELLTAWNSLPATGHPFASLSEDQHESALQLAAVEGGQPVYNFAVARVRYRGQSLPANNVRVFFRMFSTATTNMSFDANATYRSHADGGRVVPLLGIRSGDVASIPFFAVPRIDTTTSSMEDQPEDAPNKKTLAATDGGESETYFGVWLDINQGIGRFPLSPGMAAGPFAAGSVLSIKDLINGRHQCLVAEVNFENDPIPQGVTPANSDNLSQRNLAIEGSDNPGGADSHTLALTFEIDPTWNVRGAVKLRQAVPLHQERIDAATGDDAESDAAEAREARATELKIARLATVDVKAAADLRRALDKERLERVWGTPQVAFRPPMHAHAAEPVLNWIRPDELMIDWGGLPSGATALLYIPELRASDTLELLSRRWADRGVSLVDDHTLSIPVTGMSHIPIPALKPGALAALLTVQLPESVRKGQTFIVTVNQVSTISDRIVGSFELRIPVGGAENFLAAEKRWLAVLKDTVRSRPTDHRWTPVLRRLVDIVACRVRGFGGNPEEIPPSPKGYDPTQPVPCPDPDAHKPRDDDHAGPRDDDKTCDCPACIVLEALEDKRLRRTLKTLLCKRKKC